METFKVAPYDQNLMVNGEYLTENHLTLGQLKVLPGSLIFLRVSLSESDQSITYLLTFRRTNLPTARLVPVRTTWVRTIQRRASRGLDCWVDNDIVIVPILSLVSWKVMLIFYKFKKFRIYRLWSFRLINFVNDSKSDCTSSWSVVHHWRRWISRTKSLPG